MNRYKFYYDSTEKFVTKAWETFIDAPNPVSALNQFHRLMQLKSGIRSKDYKLKKLALFYNSDAWGRGSDYIESEIDLPASANPDLLKIEDNKQELQEEAPFISQLDQGRLSP